MPKKDFHSRATLKPRPRGRPPGAPTELFTIRIPTKLGDRIRAAQAEAIASSGGAAISASAFLGMLLMRGLESLEAGPDQHSTRKTVELSPADKKRIQSETGSEED
ncbi:MAG: hypothetical protein QM765_39160 [Myxococcales bacterium]